MWGFKNDKLHGEGVWYYADGSRFIGTFTEGRCENKGLKIWPDGTRYITAIDSYYHSEKMPICQMQKVTNTRHAP
jgi:hypothetical protein